MPFCACSSFSAVSACARRSSWRISRPMSLTRPLTKFPIEVSLMAASASIAGGGRRGAHRRQGLRGRHSGRARRVTAGQRAGCRALVGGGAFGVAPVVAPVDLVGSLDGPATLQDAGKAEGPGEAGTDTPYAIRRATWREQGCQEG